MLYIQSLQQQVDGDHNMYEDNDEDNVVGGFKEEKEVSWGKRGERGRCKCSTTYPSPISHPILHTISPTLHPYYHLLTYNIVVGNLERRMEEGDGYEV